MQNASSHDRQRRPVLPPKVDVPLANTLNKTSRVSSAQLQHRVGSREGLQSGSETESVRVKPTHLTVTTSQASPTSDAFLSPILTPSSATAMGHGPNTPLRSGAADKDSQLSLKSLKVTPEDPCWKFLPAALIRHNINDDWRNYALFIVYGDTERCLSLSDQPLRIFQYLKSRNQKPVFMLQHRQALPSPIAAMAQKLKKRSSEEELRRAASQKTVEDLDTQLHLKPAVAATSSKDAADGTMTGVPDETHDKPTAWTPVSFAVAIYPYVSLHHLYLSVTEYWLR